ncbi:MAG: hypothetical protein LC130_22200 [Bryobacterales bacterium]|nr:hypothetical protein [Bryobacterales bacterium]MEB2363316.1 hypothetical protein [Bryobacterales bacterium]
MTSPETMISTRRFYWRPAEVTLDSASYDPNPPEGEVLVRSGNKLVPTRTVSYSYR